jgi:hypothetical protein
MPWLGPWPDAPDTHRLWADPGSMHERALRASGFDVEQVAPGSAQDPTILLTDLLVQEEVEEDDDAP